MASDQDDTGYADANYGVPTAGFAIKQIALPIKQTRITISSVFGGKRERFPPKTPFLSGEGFWITFQRGSDYF